MLPPVPPPSLSFSFSLKHFNFLLISGNFLLLLSPLFLKLFLKGKLCSLFTDFITRNLFLLRLATTKFDLLSLTGAESFCLLFAIFHRRTVSQMTDLGAPVTTLDQFWTLILTTGHLPPLLLPGPVKLATPPVEGRQAAVTFKLDITGTLRTRRGVAGPATGVTTPVSSLGLTFPLALPAVAARRHVVRGVLHLVTVPLTRVVAASQLTTALPTAGADLGEMTGVVGCLVGAQAGYRDWELTGRAGDLLYQDGGTSLLPGSGGLHIIFHLHLDIVMT